MVAGVGPRAALADNEEIARATLALPRIGLREAIVRATQRNPDNRVALDEIRRAEALITEARSNWLPYLSANASYTRLDHDRVIAGADGTRRLLQNADQFSGNLSVAVPLIAPVAWMQTREASYRAETTRLDAVEVRRQVALSTAHAYVAVLAQRRVIEVNQRALENALDHYRYTHTRLMGGIGNELDDTRANQVVAGNKAMLETSLADLTRAQEALGVLVGADGPLDTEDSFALPELPVSEVRRDEVEAPERGDVLAGRQRVRTAQVFLRDRWANFAPALNVVFTPFYSNPASPTQPTTGWSLQGVLSVPLLQGGLRIGQRREREALLAESRAQLEGILRQAKADVRIAMSDIKHADAAYIAATQAAELAQAALKMANIAYEAGATTDIEVIDAERRARDAETSAVIAEDALRRARLDLLSATGHLP